MQGKVARLVADKGFGFITSESNGGDYFFHRDDYKDDWNELVYDWNANVEVKVKFEAGKTSKGPRASSVERLGE